MGLPGAAPLFYVLLTLGGDQDNGLTRPPDRFSRDGRSARERRQPSRACNIRFGVCRPCDRHYRLRGVTSDVGCREQLPNSTLQPTWPPPPATSSRQSMSSGTRSSDPARHPRCNLAGERRSSPWSEKLLDSACGMLRNQLAICAISFWEIALLVAKHRLEMHRRPAELRAELLDTGVIELALTGDIALLAVELKNLHGDPADRFIVATAILHNATLVTADARLLRWRGKLKRQNAQT